MRHGVGGNPQYRELWDVAYEHCCEVVNNAPENGGQSPLQKLQQDYPHVNTVDMVEEYAPMFCKVLYGVKKELRADRHSDRAGIGLWAGRKNGGHIVLPIKWNKAQSRWDVGEAKVYYNVVIKKTEFPLKTAVKKKHAGVDLNVFVDTFHPDAVDCDVYVIHKIVNKRVRAGVTQYRIKWQGYNSRDDTWEPAENITDWGGVEAILEYEQKHGNQVAMAALERELDEDERATLQLMRQHKCKGDMQDW